MPAFAIIIAVEKFSIRFFNKFSSGNMSSPTELAGSPKAVAGGEERVQAETRHLWGQRQRSSQCEQ